MLKSQVCSLFLLLPLLARLYSVNGNVSKGGCLGDSIKIFENISYNSNDIVVSIYKNGDSKLILGMWHIQDGVPSIKNGQSDRLILDKKGNIWILNLVISDEAAYTIKIDIGNSSKLYDVPLETMTPPTKNCKPNIIQAGNNLFAELKIDECGRPSASAYWLEHTGISISRQVIQLQPGNDNGIYHACIEGDSLICAKISNFSEHCSFYNKSEPKPLINQSVVDGSTPRNLPATDNSPHTSSESSTTTIIICVMVGLCLILQIVKWMKPFCQSCKCIPEPKHRQSLLGNSSPNNPLGVPEPSNRQSLPGNSSPNNPLAAVPKPSTYPGVIDDSGISNLPGRDIGTHGIDHEGTELNTISVEGENQPLIVHSAAARSSPRRSIGFPDTSTFEEEGNITVRKGLVEGDRRHMIPQRQPGSPNPKKATDASSLEEERSETVGKHPVQDPSLQEESETVGKYPVQGTVPKPTGSRPKSITPLPPAKP